MALALSGVALVGAVAMPGTPAHVQLSPEASERSVLLVHKKKKKWGKRHGVRKKLRKHRAHRRPGRTARHIAPRAHTHEFVIIFTPGQVARIDPRVEPGPGDPRHQRALQAPQSPSTYDPRIPDRDEPQVSAGSRPSSAGAGPIACDQAIGIVQDFGFSAVEPQRCSGPIYQFSALRDGQEYSISLKAADGELTKVQRQ